MRRDLPCVGCGVRLGSWGPRSEVLPGRVFAFPKYGLRFELAQRAEDDFVIEALAFLTVDDVALIREGICCAVCFAALGPVEALKLDNTLAELELDFRQSVTARSIDGLCRKHASLS